MVPGADDVLPSNVHSSVAPRLINAHVSLSVRPLTPNRAVATVGCVTDRTRETEVPPYDPFSVPVVVTPTARVAIGNVAIASPAGIMTVAGTVRGALADSTTLAPPAGAAPVSVTLPVIGLPPTTVSALELIEKIVTAAIGDTTGAGAGVTVGAVSVLEPPHALTAIVVKAAMPAVMYLNMQSCYRVAPALPVRLCTRASRAAWDAAAMKPIGIAGVVLIVCGLAALAYQGITYTTRETLIDIGPVHATADRQKTLPLPPIVGLVAVAGGAAFLIVGLRKRR